MYWQFHYPKRNAFYPPDYENPGLGGGEASLVLLTKALAARGHRVEVFNCCYRPGVYDGVQWRMCWELPEASPSDIAVAVRFDEALWPTASRASRHLFWMLDDRVCGPIAFTETFGDRGGTVVTASRAMNSRLEQADLDTIPACVPLPVEVHRYRDVEHSRRPACLWSSMPNRGLDVALAIWSKIHQAVPGAELWITSDWRLWGYTSSESEDRWKQTIGDHPLPEGAKRYGALPRQRLIDLQQRAWSTLYPSRFPEMFCLTAAESAAAGTPVITSAHDALTERVHHDETGILIDGPIEGSRTRQRFIDETVALLTDPERRERLARQARYEAQAYAPDRIAQAWEQLV